MKGIAHFFFILGIIFVLLAIVFKVSGFSQTKGITELHLSPDAFHQFGQTLLLISIGLHLCKREEAAASIEEKTESPKSSE